MSDFMLGMVKNHFSLFNGDEWLEEKIERKSGYQKDINGFSQT